MVAQSAAAYSSLELTTLGKGLEALIELGVLRVSVFVPATGTYR